MTGFPRLAPAWHASVAEIDPEEWNRLCRGRDEPFLRWEWLHLLETSGSAAPETGWHPCHLSLRSHGRLTAVAPLYLKTHSDGEFVFDHAWAQLAASMGISYYPKLVGMSPFSPVTAYRFLMAEDANPAMLSAMMCTEIERFCRNKGISGCGFHFVTPTWGRILEQMGCRVWLHQGFVWLNPGFASFDAYLAGLKSNQRRNIRRERASLDRAGISTRCLRGADIPDGLFSRMARLYARHNDGFGQWSCKFLTPEFFDGLRRVMRDNILFITAHLPGEDDPVAMSLLIVHEDRLYGRYWGASRHVPFLHFELCYYRPMQWMIEQGLRLYDPGMGGVHKALRGFVSTPNYSLHKFFDPRLQQVMRAHLGEYNHMEMQDIAALNSILPYRGKA